jgi:hypothetical protein
LGNLEGNAPKAHFLPSGRQRVEKPLSSFFCKLRGETGLNRVGKSFHPQRFLDGATEPATSAGGTGRTVISITIVLVGRERSSAADHEIEKKFVIPGAK